VTVADVIRAVDGPLAAVRGERPETVAYAGPAQPLQRVWIAVRKNLRDVVEHVTLADLAAGELPPEIDALAEDPDSWVTR
jgi:DNA-binding IscR family transcriptional regulator